MAFYPNLKEETIMTMELVMKSLEKDPLYLDVSECPYSDVIKSFFRRAESASVVDNIFEGQDDTEVMDIQIQKVLSDLDTMGAKMASAENSDRLNYYKTKTVLLEKLITMKERVFNLKELSEFRSVLMQGLEDICDKDQITAFMKRLDSLLGTGTEV